jgi:hypothetical protein
MGFTLGHRADQRQSWDHPTRPEHLLEEGQPQPLGSECLGVGVGRRREGSWSQESSSFALGTQV